MPSLDPQHLHRTDEGHAVEGAGSGLAGEGDGEVLGDLELELLPDRVVGLAAFLHDVEVAEDGLAVEEDVEDALAGLVAGQGGEAEAVLNSLGRTIPSAHPLVLPALRDDRELPAGQLGEFVHVVMSPRFHQGDAIDPHSL